MSIVEGFHAAYPQFDPAALLTPAALAKARSSIEKCDITGTYSSSSDPVLAHNPLDTPALAAIVHTNSPATVPPGAHCSSCRELPTNLRRNLSPMRS